MDPAVWSSLGDEVAVAIVAGMREVALADGKELPGELALISQMEEGLPDGIDADSVTLDSPEAKQAYLQFLALVALADHGLSNEERAVMVRLAAKHGMDESAVETALTKTATAMLSRFQGATLFRDQAEAVGAALGLSAADIAATLDA